MDDIFDYNADIDEMDDDDTSENKYVSFSLDNREFAIQIQHVNEIIGMQKYVALPETANYISGVIKLRDRIYPVIDMRKRFFLPEAKYDDRNCIIIVTISNLKIGLIVDCVNSVPNIPKSDISFSNDEAVVCIGTDYIKGIGKVADKVIIILDVEKIFSSKDKELLEKIK